MTQHIDLKIKKPLIPLQNELGESPIWNVSQQKLYWIDIERGLLQTYHPATATFAEFGLGVLAGCITFTKNGYLLVATQNGLSFWDDRTGLHGELIQFFQEDDSRMMNDGKISPTGNFWVGSKGPHQASSLYRVLPDYSFTRQIDQLTISNGLDWTPDQNYFYHCDSGNNMVLRYIYHPENDSISSPEPFFRSDRGVPDGLTVDSQGNVWIALWDGWRVIGIRPDGVEFCSIQMPVSRPTSVCFGGPALDTLFITSARTGLDPLSLVEEPLAGSLFSIHVTTVGKTGNLFANE